MALSPSLILFMRFCKTLGVPQQKAPDRSPQYLSGLNKRKRLKQYVVHALPSRPLLVSQHIYISNLEGRDCYYIHGYKNKVDIEDRVSNSLLASLLNSLSHSFIPTACQNSRYNHFQA